MTSAATPRVLLLDLDDTLLGNPMDRFIPAYFDALTRALAPWVEPSLLLRELLAGTRAMDLGDGSGPTNHEAFAEVFYPAVGVDRSELEPRILDFYRDDFPRLRSLTETRPEAAALLTWARRRDLPVVIATNPLFPRIAIDHRIMWAGIDPDDDAICLITSAENMRATKARPAYYREILERVGHQPHDCLMVGDDWEWDIVQAGRVGIPAWWIADAAAVPPDGRRRPVGEGDLAACGRWLDRPG